MTNAVCECDFDTYEVVAHPSLYDPVKELPFVVHKPNECKCTNNLQLYTRNGKAKLLCSNCCLSSDKRVVS